MAQDDKPTPEEISTYRGPLEQANQGIDDAVESSDSDFLKAANKGFDDLISGRAGEKVGDALYDLHHNEDGSTNAVGTVLNAPVAAVLESAVAIEDDYQTFKAKNKPECSEDATDIDDESTVDRLRFQEQCFLIENYDQISPINFTTSYNNFTCLHGDPSLLVTNLNSSRHLEPFTKITPAQLSQLVPTFRLFKVLYDNNGNEKGTIEFEFDDYYKNAEQQEYINNQGTSDSTYEALKVPKITRGGGVGLKSFDWKYIGSNPAEATKIIEAEMKIRFETIHDATKERISKDQNGNDVKYRFVDLLLPEKKFDGYIYEDQKYSNRSDTHMDAITGSKIYNPNYFTIKAIVGWADPGNALSSDLFEDKEEFRRALRKIRRVLVLTLTNHDWEFTQEGPAYLTVKFQARWDIATSSDKSDVFNVYDSRIDAMSEARSALAQRIGAFECLEDNVKNFESEEKQKVKASLDELKRNLQSEKERVYSQFFKELFDSENLLKATVPIEQIGLFLEKSYFGNLINQGWFDETLLKTNNCISDLRSGASNYDIKISDFYDRPLLRGQGSVDEITDSLKEQLGEQQRKAIDEDSGVYNIPFLFLGDALDIGFKALMKEDNQYTKDMKILVGDITLEDPQRNLRASVNLADIPVSMRLFQEWFIDVIWSKQRENYPVRLFMRDIAEKLIVEAISPLACFEGLNKRNVKISFTSFNLPKRDGKDVIDPDDCGRAFLENFKEFDFENKAKLDTTTYFMLYASSETPDHLVADYDEDVKRGITHFGLGEDRGILKKMTFSRNDFKFVREARIVDDEFDNEFRRLREYFSAELTLVGNEIYVPGQIIYINPSTIAFGNPDNPHSVSQALGLVGYYQVIEVQNYIESGVFETKVKANWVSSGLGHQGIDLNQQILRECKVPKADKPKMQSALNQNDFDKLKIVAPNENAKYLACPDVLLAKLTDFAEREVQRIREFGKASISKKKEILEDIAAQSGVGEEGSDADFN